MDRFTQHTWNYVQVIAWIVHRNEEAVRLLSDRGGSEFQAREHLQKLDAKFSDRQSPVYAVEVELGIALESGMVHCWGIRTASSDLPGNEREGTLKPISMNQWSALRVFLDDGSMTPANTHQLARINWGVAFACYNLETDEKEWTFLRFEREGILACWPPGTGGEDIQYPHYSSAEINQHRRGPRSEKRAKTAQIMLAELIDGQRTPEELKADTEEAMRALYGYSRQTVREARQIALSEFEKRNTDKTPSNNK